MDCSEVGKFLQVYIDGELNDQDRYVLEEHLASCPACRLQADSQRRFRQAIRARIPRAMAPAGLREKLQERMLAGADRRTFPRRLVWGSVPAVAALALVVTFTWTVTSGFSVMVDEAVQRHSKAPPVEVNTSDSDEVESWFKEKVDFNVAIPRFRTQRFSLVGARLSHLARKQAALVRYRRGKHNFSLFVVSDPGESLDGRACRRVRSRKVCLTERRGYTVLLWRSRGLAYSMVGDSDAREMVDVLSSALSF